MRLWPLRGGGVVRVKVRGGEVGERCGREGGGGGGGGESKWGGVEGGGEGTGARELPGWQWLVDGCTSSDGEGVLEWLGAV